MAELEYTVFVRVPAPRGDFVDPPQVHWDPSKDEALWKMLSGAAQTEIDWNQAAERFNVPVDFLLQQVAYLTERHASQVRAQVRKATAAAKGSSAPTPTPTPVADSQRTASAQSVRRASPLPRQEGSAAVTPIQGSARPVVSRNASTNTILRDVGGSSPRVPARAPEQGGRRRLSSLPVAPPAAKLPDAVPENGQARPVSPGPAESSSTTSSDDESSPAQSRIIRRPPRYQPQEASQTYHDDDDDDESEPAFQPYQADSTQTSAQDMASTLKDDAKSAPRRGLKSAGKDLAQHSQTSDSSGGSAAMLKRSGKHRESKDPGPLSPRRTAELAGRSPSGKGKAGSHEGSDGTPSMGSSFSDLDDASVTQSALEEALASHMNRGAVSSRFSISGAFRSRYNPGSNQ